jgi:hypothetical protein
MIMPGKCCVMGVLDYVIIQGVCCTVASVSRWKSFKQPGWLRQTIENKSRDNS